MDLELQAALDEFSVIAVWSAITLYVLAFIAFAYDLSQRASLAPTKQRETVLVGAGASSAPPAREPAEPSLRMPAS